ncbi:NADH dehydrogenase (ubiquinone) MWFE subunit [Tachypleus tridentatus]|uniref:NADH dehydrogenase (ubiquinone) MWFE subunit n=1 Tax=Tachypleus tridentatus TaxID=6853 RepID=UPI003FD00F53
MWYEILPSAAIIFTCLSIPSFATWGINYIVLGKPMKRALKTNEDQYLFLRDTRLTGKGHKTVGLEALPDKE